MQIEKRAKILIKELKIPMKDIASHSNINVNSWNAALNGRQRMTTDQLEFLGRNFKEYAYWLMTGDTDVNKGEFPKDRAVIEHFERKALDFAKALVESTYLLSYQYAVTCANDENTRKSIRDIMHATPIGVSPEDRATLIEHHYISILQDDFGDAINADEYDPKTQLKAIDKYFEKLSNELLIRIENVIGNLPQALAKYKKLFSKPMLIN